MRKLLFFYAPWCSPCKFFEREFMNPVLEQADPIQVEMINVQENPTCADRYGVNRLPTEILTDGEKIVDYVGMPDVEKAVNFLRGGE